MAADIEPIRWEGYSLEDKHRWVAAGRGAQATWPAEDGLRRLGERFTASDGALKTTLSDLHAGWTGIAAERAGGALSKAADWSASAAAAGRPGSAAIEAYGSSFEGLRSRVPEPNTPTWFDQVKTGAVMAIPGGAFIAQADIQQRVQDGIARNNEANMALRAHERATHAALDAFPSLTSAPPITAPGSGGSGAGGAGGSGLDAVGASAVGAGSAVAGGPGSGGPGSGGPGLGGAASPLSPASGQVAAGLPVVPGVPVAGGRSPGLVRPPDRGGGAAGGAAPTGSRPGGGRPGQPPSPGLGRESRGGPGHGGSGGVALPPRPPAEHVPGEQQQGPRAQGTRGAAGGSAGVGSVPPWLAGGTVGRPEEREHRNRFYIPTDEAFDVELPPHVPPVINAPE